MDGYDFIDSGEFEAAELIFEAILAEPSFAEGASSSASDVANEFDDFAPMNGK